MNSMEEKLLPKERRLKIVKKLQKKGIAELIDDEPAYYLVNLNHYGGQAFVNIDGVSFGHSFEYQAESELTYLDRIIIDEKLAQLHPEYFSAPMDNDQRKNGIDLLTNEIDQPEAKKPISVNIKFPDSEMAQIETATGKITRKHCGCMWSYEFAEKQLPTLIRHQIDNQLTMIDDLMAGFTTEKYNKLFKYQVEVTEKWKNVNKKVKASLPDKYWRKWNKRNISIPSRKPVKE